MTLVPMQTFACGFAGSLAIEVVTAACFLLSHVIVRNLAPPRIALGYFHFIFTIQAFASWHSACINRRRMRSVL